MCMNIEECIVICSSLEAANNIKKKIEFVDKIRFHRSVFGKGQENVKWLSCLVCKRNPL